MIGSELKAWLTVSGLSALLLLLLLLRHYVPQRAGARAGAGNGQGVQIGNGQTIGKREEQDDYFATATVGSRTMAVVADGISGLANGRLASMTAVSAWMKQFMKQAIPAEQPTFFSQAAALANSEVVRELGGARGGTTLAAVVIVDGYLYWGAVGDSVIALYRNGELRMVNKQHTLEAVLEERYLAGEITASEAAAHPGKRQLVNYLGYEQFKSLDIGEPIPLKKEDRVLLCTDGITNSLTELELCMLLEQEGTADVTVERIIEAVEEKRLSYQDNATVILLEKGW